MNEDVMKPTAWMIRDQNGAVYWDETECVFSNKQAAEDCACGLTDGAQDGEVFSVFPLYAEPAHPVEAVDVLITMDANGSFFLHTPDGQVWRGDDWITFGPAEIYPDYKSAMMGRKVAIAALAHPRPTGDGKVRIEGLTFEEAVAKNDGFIEGYAKGVAESAPTVEQTGEVVDDGIDYLHALDQADVALGVAGLGENAIFRVELRRAREHFAAQPRPVGVPDGEVARLREALEWIVKRPSMAAEGIALNALAGGSYPPPKNVAAPAPEAK